MPLLLHGDVRLHYEFDFQLGRPVLMLSNSLGTDISMWSPQMPAFAQHFSVLRYDARGHGQSSTPPGPYTIADMGRDALALLDALHITRVNFCGLSMGGMVGQWLAIHAPERLERVVLSNTAAQIGTASGWNDRISALHTGGMSAVVPGVLDRWYTAGFRERGPQAVERTAAMLLTMDPVGYAASCAAVRDMDLRDALTSIDVPVLIVYGSQDPVTPPESAQFLQQHIQGARSFALDAAHLANVEAADTFTSTVLAFLLEASGGGSLMDEAERYEQGLKVRREVLGSAHVDRTLANRTRFNEPFQEFITRYAWGEIWTRPGLPRHTRSLLTLAMTVALNREEEFKLHIRAALTNGVTREEIREVLLQSAIYCGLPAANNAFHWAESAFAAIDADGARS